MIGRVISGGQTGVDRGALDASLAVGVAVGGRCPKGRRTEDGIIAARYPLCETQSTYYIERTQANVFEADATLILAPGAALTDGTAYTKHYAEANGRPVRLVVADDESGVTGTLAWLDEMGIAILNVAGPRESGASGIQIKAEAFIRAL